MTPKQPFSDLRSFIDTIERRGDLARIEVPVDAHLEAAEIHRRVIAAGGPALWFDNVTGADFPLVTNLFGTPQRALLAFGERPFDLIRRAVGLVEDLSGGISQFWAHRDLLGAVLRTGTRRVKRGPVTEVITSPCLDRLPILTCWPRDGGAFVTLPLVYTEHPQRKGHNLGIYRLQRHDAFSTGMHWQIGKGGGFHYAAAQEQGESLPVTVFLGGPPALILAAIAPLPENVPELLLASLLAGQKLPLVKGPGAHRLIASAEFALLGKVPPDGTLPEGPFGDHYGYYSLQHDYPVFEIDRVAHRRDAIFPATVVGKPRQEDFFIGNLLQELLSPLFPLVMPAIEELWSYGETGFHSLAAAVVKQRYAREAMASAFRILGEGQLSLTKFLLLTDQPVELTDFKATLRHLLARTRPETDLYVFSQLSMDTLDYTGPEVNRGSKGVWMGLGDPVRNLPHKFSGALPPGVDEAICFCPGCLVLGTLDYRQAPELASQLTSHPELSDWPLVVLSNEPRRAAASPINFLWTTFTRFEPAADLYGRSPRVNRHHLSYRFPIIIDARIKPSYPEELHCDPETKRRVDRRWLEYFPQGMEMGDSEAAHLDPALPR